MTQQQRPTAKQRRLRGYLPSPDGLRKLEEKKFEKGYSYETLAAEAGLASDDQVKRLFHPHWGRKVQKETIEKIAKALDLKPTDIVTANQWNPSPAKNQPTEPNMIVFQGELETQMTEDEALATQFTSLMLPLDSAGVKRQEMLSGVEVTGNLEAGDLAQKAQHNSSVEQKMATNLKAENIKFGNLTQES
jgi:DNA-binding Xre family transcriptional regulator